MSASVGVGQSSWVWVGWQDPHPWWKPILSPQQPSVTSNSSAKYRTLWALVYSCWDFDWIDLVRVLFMYSQPPCVHIHSVPVMTGNHCPMVTHHCLWLLESFHPLLQWPLSSRKRTVIDMAFRTGYSIADISISLIKKKNLPSSHLNCEHLDFHQINVDILPVTVCINDHYDGLLGMVHTINIWTICRLFINYWHSSSKPCHGGKVSHLNK